MSDDDQLNALTAVNPNAELRIDGGVVCVLMPKTTIQTAGGPETMDLVLCPRGLGGYVTRLLLERKVTSKIALNWQPATLLGRLWHTFSWNNIAAEQAWLKIFAEHARLLR